MRRTTYGTNFRTSYCHRPTANKPRTIKCPDRTVHGTGGTISCPDLRFNCCNPFKCKTFLVDHKLSTRIWWDDRIEAYLLMM